MFYDWLRSQTHLAGFNSPLQDSVRTHQIKTFLAILDGVKYELS